MPGLIDAHIHLESAMALPAEFARAAIPHATTTVIADPHEITNVMGEDVLEYMLQATEGLPLDVFSSLPSCVPATPFDENGADIDYIVRRAIAAGADPLLVVRMASYNAARYFNLVGYGAVACGYVADLAVVDSLESFQVLQVYKRGTLVFGEGGVASFDAPVVSARLEQRVRDTFHMPAVSAAALMDGRQRGVVGLEPRSIVTRDCGLASRIDVAADILKVAVVERHRSTGHVGVGYLKGYGLARGAVATSISHDSHNVIAVGASEEDMAQAGNLVAQMGGGIVVMEGGQVKASVALPIAGLMGDASLAEVNRDLETAKRAAYDMGVSPDADPFMTLSFMSLSVIPVLRVTTRGVFNVDAQSY